MRLTTNASGLFSTCVCVETLTRRKNPIFLLTHTCVWLCLRAVWWRLYANRTENWKGRVRAYNRICVPTVAASLVLHDLTSRSLAHRCVCQSACCALTRPLMCACTYLCQHVRIVVLSCCRPEVICSCQVAESAVSKQAAMNCWSMLSS